MMTEIKDKLTNEVYFRHKHSTGLDIYLFNKKGFSTSYALFGTKFGSVDNAFSVNGKSYTVPDGVAHFLEHKLFESEERDAFELFSKTGAYSNAYTSFDRTCYLFKCSSGLQDNLKILLDFVQNPYFTAETVRKEQGIIGQEIKMYEDNPDWRVMFNLFEALYHNNPIKIDIAGSVESIAQIDDKILYNCYNTFYNLNNMFLCIAGDFDNHEILDIIDKGLKPNQNDIQFSRDVKPEPEEIVKPYIEQPLQVAKPMFMLGYKLKTGEYYDIKDKISLSVLQELICGKISPLYEKLSNEGIITEEFECEVFDSRNTAAVFFSNESDNPKQVADEIYKEIDRLKKDGINESEFKAVVKKMYGSEIIAYDKIETIGSMLVECAVTGEELFKPVNIIKNLTVKDVEDALKYLDKSVSALSVITVKE